MKGGQIERKARASWRASAMRVLVVDRRRNRGDEGGGGGGGAAARGRSRPRSPLSAGCGNERKAEARP